MFVLLRLMQSTSIPLKKNTWVIFIFFSSSYIQFTNVEVFFIFIYYFWCFCFLRDKYNLFPDNLSQTLMYKMLRLISVFCLWNSFLLFMYFHANISNFSTKWIYIYTYILIQFNKYWKLNYNAIEKDNIGKFLWPQRRMEAIIIWFF